MFNVGSLALRRSKSDKESNGQNCTNHLQIIDRCSSMATYSYTATLNPYPQTMNEMKTSCDRIGEGIRCLKVHVRCLHSLSRRSLNAYTTARSRHSRRLCANMNDQKVTEFIKASDCVRQKGKLASMVGDEKELISNLQSLAVNSTMKWDDRFHRACCAASKYKNQVLIHLEPQCNQYKTITEDMLNSMVGELLEAACPDDRRLVEICAKQPVFKVPDSWQGGSLTRAALDVITILAETSDKDDKRD